MNTEFIWLDNEELDNVNGGSILVGAILVAVALVGDHVLEEQTGRDAVEWTGYAMTQAGVTLQNWGQALMQ